jgi:hypothetical protein
VSSVAHKSLALCQTFEAELLLELMLRQWEHPLADDNEFRGQLLETVTAVLEEAVQGTSFVEGVPPADMNFVAALYYAELRACEDAGDVAQQRELREKWLTRLRHCLPSCFCDPGLLE